MSFRITFLVGKSGTAIAYINRHVAFPGKNWPKDTFPRPGEEWEVEEDGLSPNGNTIFLKPVMRVRFSAKDEALAAEAETIPPTKVAADGDLSVALSILESYKMRTYSVQEGIDRVEIRLRNGFAWYKNNGGKITVYVSIIDGGNWQTGYCLTDAEAWYWQSNIIYKTPGDVPLFFPKELDDPRWDDVTMGERVAISNADRLRLSKSSPGRP